MSLAVISRPAAKAVGLKRYFTGAPCKYGHTAERQVSNGTCLRCMVAKYKERRPELLAKSKARMNALYAKDPERFRERSKTNYAADPETWKTRTRAWEAAHPLPVRVRHHLKKRRHVPGKFSVDDVTAKFNEQNNRCLCGADLTIAWQIDHIMPICRGGTNLPDNIQILCPDCNKDKGTKTMAEWIK